jgi:hypothetical protein
MMSCLCSMSDGMRPTVRAAKIASPLERGSVSAVNSRSVHPNSIPPVGAFEHLHRICRNRAVPRFTVRLRAPAPNAELRIVETYQTPEKDFRLSQNRAGPDGYCERQVWGKKSGSRHQG